MPNPTPWDGILVWILICLALCGAKVIAGGGSGGWA